MRNRIVREETCFDCNKKIVCMEHEPYNHTEYIPVTVIRNRVINKVVVCHRCFNAHDYAFTVTGWTRQVPTAREQGATLIPVLALITAFTVAAVIVAQSGLLRYVVARLAAIL